MYLRLTLSLLLTFNVNFSLAACESTDDVCLELQSEGGNSAEAKPFAASQVVHDESVESSASQQLSDSQELIDLITSDLKARRLTRPLGDNALEKIRRLQVVNPEHDYSINGVRYVARIYLSMARDDLNNSRITRAKLRLDAAVELYPTLPNLASVRDRLRAASRGMAADMKEPVAEDSAVSESSPAAVTAQTTAATATTTTTSNTTTPTITTPTTAGPDTAVADNALPEPSVIEGAVKRVESDGALITPIMVGLPAGKFVMGSESGADNEKPAHQLQAGAFSMSRYEITWEQYQAFKVDIGEATTELDARRSRLPVTGITWHDAVAYTRWLSSKTGKRYRLPTESEWEYAIRAGSVTPYHSGDIIFGAANCLTCLDEIPQSATVVGSFAPNDFGLYDMHGNVSEWTSSCLSENYFQKDESSVSEESVSQQACTRRVVRGGSWRSTRDQVRASFRTGKPASARSMDTGFRVAHDGL